MGNKKWNHVECTTCTKLKLAAKDARLKKNVIAQKGFEGELQQHYDEQDCFRFYYISTRSKAVRNHHCDISMHVDGAGADGLQFSPYFPQEIAAGEDPQHTLLRTHNIFTKIHGFGRFIYQSYPQVERQGTNLVVEIIYRSIYTYMRKTSQKVLRNVYIQMDNHSINKSNCMICAMAALVLLGVCRRVCIIFLFLLNIPLSER